MEVLAIIFALVMFAAAGAATVTLWWAVGFWAALGFALILFALYKASTSEAGSSHPRHSDGLNAFQQPLADPTPAPARDGYRNRSYRRHFQH